MTLIEGAGQGNTGVTRRNWLSDYQDLDSPMSPESSPRPFRQETQSIFFFLIYFFKYFLEFFGCATRLAESLFPSQGLNPGRGSESLES